MLAQPRQFQLHSAELVDLSKWRNSFRPNLASAEYFLCLVFSGQVKVNGKGGSHIMEESQYLCLPSGEKCFLESTTGTVGCIHFTDLDHREPPRYLGSFSHTRFLRTLFEKVAYRFLRCENVEAGAALSVIMDELNSPEEASFPSDLKAQNDKVKNTQELQGALRMLKSIDWTTSQRLNMAASTEVK